ncbi:hypothetical protein JL721_4442 [Aureococcus anophagefferens]|nr:hypothetical protein JL721_4442 [Aureococcus anophagefferens]
MSGFASGYQLKRLRGLLEKKSSDGTWRVQFFTAHKSKLYYMDPDADLTEQPPRASMDLLEGLAKIERKGEKLVLWVDDKRRHQLRSCRAPSDADGPQPSLDDWELSLRERRLVAKKLREERAARRAARPARPSREDLRSADYAGRRVASGSRRRQRPQYSGAAKVYHGAKPAMERSPGSRPGATSVVGRVRREDRRGERADEAAAPAPAPAAGDARPAPCRRGRRRPRRAPERWRPTARDRFLAADVDRLSMTQLREGLMAAGFRDVDGSEPALRRKAADLQDRLLGRPPQPARAAPASVRQGLDDDEDDDDDDDKAARAKIIAFYQKHNPNKVRDVDALIIKYRDVGVGASELLLAVQKKYARSQEKKSNQFSV